MAAALELQLVDAEQQTMAAKLHWPNHMPTNYEQTIYALAPEGECRRDVLPS